MPLRKTTERKRCVTCQVTAAQKTRERSAAFFLYGQDCGFLCAITNTLQQNNDITFVKFISIVFSTAKIVGTMISRENTFYTNCGEKNINTLRQISQMLQ